MRVLHVSPSFYPAVKWGGPIFSTKAICDGVSNQYHVDLKVITTDAAGPNLHERLLIDNNKVNLVKEGYSVQYFRRIASHSVSIGLLLALPNAIRWADIVHLSTTYSFPVLPTIFLCRIFDKPLVWSPRGAIQATLQWEDAPRKSVKKLFERFAEFLAGTKTVVHVTSRDEAGAVNVRLPKLVIVDIPNCVEVPNIYHSYRRKDNFLRLMYLSRLHPKKGLEILLDAMLNLPDYFLLDVYGEGDQVYTRQLKNRVLQSGLETRVRFHGNVNGFEKSHAFSSADIFVLPSFSENFGIVVVEALAHGLPVITTDRTPWRDLDKVGCGRCVSPCSREIQEAIVGVSENDYRTMGEIGRAWVDENYSPRFTAEAMFNLYQSMIRYTV